MPLEIDVYNKELVATKTDYTTVAVLLTSDLPPGLDVVEFSLDSINSRIDSVSAAVQNVVYSDIERESIFSGLSSIDNIIVLPQDTYDSISENDLRSNTLYVVI